MSADLQRVIGPDATVTVIVNGLPHRVALTRLDGAANIAAAAMVHIGEQVIASIRVWSEAAHALNLPETPPADPRDRALWLRQHRNTGPAGHKRAPKHLDTTARRRTR